MPVASPGLVLGTILCVNRVGSKARVRMNEQTQECALVATKRLLKAEDGKQFSDHLAHSKTLRLRTLRREKPSENFDTAIYCTLIRAVSVHHDVQNHDQARAEEAPVPGTLDLS